VCSSTERHPQRLQFKIQSHLTLLMTGTGGGTTRTPPGTKWAPAASGGGAAPIAEDLEVLGGSTFAAELHFGQVAARPTKFCTDSRGTSLISGRHPVWQNRRRCSPSPAGLAVQPPLPHTVQI
jgi:hypothetical protein